MDDLFSDAVRQLLAGTCTPALVRDVEAGTDTSAARAKELWRAIDEAGFADAMVDEDSGGAGMDFGAVFPLFSACGAHAVPLPLGETVLARALLARSSVTVPAGSITLAIARTASAHGGAAALVCDSVVCGRVADWVLVQRGAQCRLLPVASARSTPAVFCLDASLTWANTAWDQAPIVSGAGDLRLLQACLYAAQLAGALNVVFERTLQYANDRQQFGRPIGKFQAIQHQISVMSEHSFAADMAARSGCSSCSGSSLAPDPLRVAVAKARTSEAAVEVAALAHSVHGAIGFTKEFDLQLFTRRLHAWRQAGGAESYWHVFLGAELVDRRSGMAVDFLYALGAQE